jgi:hypothetical protein
MNLTVKLNVIIVLKFQIPDCSGFQLIVITYLRQE